jgi:ribose transport system ATP-binding protein
MVAHEDPSGEQASEIVAPLLQMRGITKRFPGVIALDDVDLQLERGEVHVLLGENGAGKSTLVKILSGAYPPDEGEILIDGRPARIPSAIAAQRLGISTIYQEFNLVPGLSVAENIFLGRQPRRLGVVDRRTMGSRAAEILERIRVRVRPDDRVADLSVAQRQMVEIAKALSLDARILIMDEPTAVLSEQEIRHLFGIIGDLKRSGVSIIFISHHLEEVGMVGDRVTILRDGKVAGHTSAQAPAAEFVRLMVGRSIENHYPRRRTEPGEVLLRVRDLSRKGVLQGISLELHAGEVVGVAGLVGAGRTELMRAIFGADPIDSGEVWVGNHRIGSGDLRQARRQGVGLVPEDRQGQGLVLPLSVGENLTLVALQDSTQLGMVRRGELHGRAERMVRDLRIRTPGLGQVVRNLSGGNQQKVVIGKWLLADARVLILDEPTRGIDVGAKVELYELMNKLTAQGTGILMVSSDLPEVLGMSDRILVMSEGRITGELPAAEATQEKVMQLATPKSRAAV